LTLRKQLIDWWATLPEETCCRDLNPSGGLFRSNVHLKLDYCLTRIFIGRPFIFSSAKGTNQPAPNGPLQKAATGRSKGRSTLVIDCVEAALEIIDLCRLLRDETGLARASYTEFSSCRAALLVILAQSLTKRTERLRNALEQGMAMIKTMSMGVGSARSSVNDIEVLERAIRRLEALLEAQAQNNTGAVDSGYERFKNWEMLWKNGPVSPATATFQGQVAGAGTRVHLAPVATATTGSTNGTMRGSDADSAAAGSDTTTSPPSQMPHFGFEGFVSNFPQELGEFTAIPCFEGEGQQGMGGGEVEGHGGSGDARWMNFIMN